MSEIHLKPAALSLLGISSLGIALPLFETLGKGATFFVVHGASATDIVLFTCTVYFLPAAVLFLFFGLTRTISPLLSKVVVSVGIGLLAALWAIRFVQPMSTVLAISIVLAFGLVVGFAFYQQVNVQKFMQFLGYISPVVIIIFLLFTPVRTLISPDNSTQASGNSGKKTPIVMLVLDELSQAALTSPSGLIDAGRLPNFERLRRMSTWYSNTTTVSTQTEKAVPAILSGMRVHKDTQPIYSQFPRNLFSALSATHSVNAIETVTRLCHESICAKSKSQEKKGFDGRAMYWDVGYVWLHLVFPHTLAEKYLSPISSKWSGFGQESERGLQKDQANWFATLVADLATNQKKRFGKFTSQIKDSSGASLNYLHLALPHIPWIYLPDGTVYNGHFAPGQSAKYYDWSSDQHLVDQGALRYALQLEYVDYLLGNVLDALTDSNRMNETMLIVVADHGVAFAAGKQRRIPESATLADVARVPLFIKYPEQVSAEIDSRKVETIDIFPTILDVLDFPDTGSFDGQSLRSSNWEFSTRQLLELETDITDFETAQDMSRASSRFYRVLEFGKSALDSMGRYESRQYFKKTIPEEKIDAGKLTLLLDRPEWYQRVRKASGFLPARLTGKTPGAKPGTEIIIELNGNIAGNGFTYTDSGDISIMLDPRNFTDGANKLVAYQVLGDELRTVIIAPQESRWTISKNSEGGIELKDKTGQTYTSDIDLQGLVKFPRPRSPRKSVSGWAYDGRHLKAPNSLLLINGDKVVSTGFRLLANATAAQQEGVPEDLEYWFSLEMPPRTKQLEKRHSVLAIFDDFRFIQLTPK